MWYFRQATIYTSAYRIVSKQPRVPKGFKVVFPITKYSYIAKLDGFDDLHPKWKDQFEQRLSSSDYQLLAICHNSSLSYFAWISNTNEIDEYLNWNSGSVSEEPYLFHCFTLENYRRQGLHQLATMYLIHHFENKGRIIWGIIYKNNTIAHRAWIKSGMLLRGKILSFGILGFKRTILNLT